MKLNFATSIFVLCFVYVGRASAQFVGDMYFETPSVAVESGSSVTIDVDVFTGTHVFGAARFDVEFDPQALSFDGEQSEPVAATELRHRLKLDANRIRVVAVNGRNSSKPFGGVRLVRLAFTAIGAPGTSTNLTIIPRGLLDFAENPLTGNGFGGQVSITTPQTPLPARTQAAAVGGAAAHEAVAQYAPEVIDVESFAAAGLVEMGRAGSAVIVRQLQWSDGRWVTRPVLFRTRDPEAQRRD